MPYFTSDPGPERSRVRELADSLRDARSLVGSVPNMRGTIGTGGAKEGSYAQGYHDAMDVVDALIKAYLETPAPSPSGPTMETIVEMARVQKQKNTMYESLMKTYGL